MVQIRKEQAITRNLNRWARASDRYIGSHRDKQHNRIDVIQDFLDCPCTWALVHPLFVRCFIRCFVLLLCTTICMKCFDFVEWCVIFINTLMSLQNLNKSVDDEDDERKKTRTKYDTHKQWLKLVIDNPKI